MILETINNKKIDIHIIERIDRSQLQYVIYAKNRDGSFVNGIEYRLEKTENINLKYANEHCVIKKFINYIKNDINN
jgi:hypothetical protein